jgi:hypothetical protein
MMGLVGEQVSSSHFNSHFFKYFSPAPNCFQVYFAMVSGSKTNNAIESLELSYTFFAG